LLKPLGLTKKLKSCCLNQHTIPLNENLRTPLKKEKPKPGAANGNYLFISWCCCCGCLCCLCCLCCCCVCGFWLKSISIICIGSTHLQWKENDKRQPNLLSTDFYVSS